ncbi:hypothetical protein M9H77_06982 [Catharanthus roseus]|uniref:Uncharacterized protein n=1 Tax=Catharanthus roseus TaxID=4058 RepID=A0ACC0BTX4_CATRO|nr:hypothetical protein M9H77_06982 [Catharanthus roseus]
MLAPTNDIVDNVNTYILLLLLVVVPIMLLHNTKQSKELCNGTRLSIIRLGESVIEAEVITGTSTGKANPNKILLCNDINKSQGKTFENIGVFSPKPVFCPGQLYVAASRVTSCNGLKFYIDNTGKCQNNMVKNICYSEIFSNMYVGESGT